MTQPDESSDTGDPREAVTSGGAPPGDEPGHDAAPPRRRSRAARTAIEWVVVIALAVGLALFVRAFVVQTYYIPSGSMEPTLQVGDRILVVKLAYHLGTPHTGDVIVFRAPPDEQGLCGSAGVIDLVKRVVAVPGQLITSHGNLVYVNGRPLRQPWSHTAALGREIERTYVQPGQYFVLGDNRPNSCDSRVWGLVPQSDIIGKAVVVFWPLSDFKKL